MLSICHMLSACSACMGQAYQLPPVQMGNPLSGPGPHGQQSL
jgi:hypothetical protein